MYEEVDYNVLFTGIPLKSEEEVKREHSALDVVKGINFNKKVTLDDLIAGLTTSGIQCTEIGRAIKIINDMIKWRVEDAEDFEEDDLTSFKKRRTVIYLGFSSSIISGGCRDIIRYLFEHKMIGYSVTTAGGVEEDLIKCFGDY